MKVCFAFLVGLLLLILTSVLGSGWVAGYDLTLTPTPTAAPTPTETEFQLQEDYWYQHCPACGP